MWLFCHLCGVLLGSFRFISPLSLERVQMGRRVVISDNDCVAPSHRSSEERLREETERVEGQPRGRVCSPWLLGVSCNMWLYFLSQNFETTLGAAFLFLFLLLLQSCSWSAWLLFFPLHLFFWKQFKRHLEKLMKQFAIYLGGFFFFWGRSKAIWRQ